jgi:hypothetical protein
MSKRRMTHSAGQLQNHNLPKGIQRSRPLPDQRLGALWDSIVLDNRVKSQLLSQAMLNLTLRGKVDRSVIPLHGIILLVAPRAQARPRWLAAWPIAQPNRSRVPSSVCCKWSRTRRPVWPWVRRSEQCRTCFRSQSPRRRPAGRPSCSSTKSKRWPLTGLRWAWKQTQLTFITQPMPCWCSYPPRRDYFGRVIGACEQTRRGQVVRIFS